MTEPMPTRNEGGDQLTKNDADHDDGDDQSDEQVLDSTQA